MAYTLVGEKIDSRKSKVGWQGSTEDLVYLIQGGEDDAQARLCVAANAPGTIANPGDPTTIFENYDLDYMGGGYWIATVHYAQRTPKQPGDTTYNFETGGGTQKITQAISNVNRYRVGGATPADHKGAIGVKDGKADGVDISVPVYTFSETHYIPTASVTAAYKAAIFAVTGKTNNAGFKGFNTGEVLFLGASGCERSQDDWEITFKFAASPNVTGLTIGAITGIAKKGWEYLWVEYDTAVSNDALAAQPRQVNVDQVYYSGDLSTLGIGT
jgi:hypothetical protein